MRLRRRGCIPPVRDGPVVDVAAAFGGSDIAGHFDSFNR